MNDQTEYLKWLSDLELALRYVRTKLEEGEQLNEREEEILRDLFDIYDDGLEVGLVAPVVTSDAN